jgi:hypothetical protein
VADAALYGGSAPPTPDITNAGNLLT